VVKNKVKCCTTQLSNQPLEIGTVLAILIQADIGECRKVNVLTGYMHWQQVKDLWDKKTSKKPNHRGAQYAHSA